MTDVTDGLAVRRASRWPHKTAKFATLAYWWPLIGLDLMSLLRWGFSVASAQRTLRMLVVESIAYLVVWSLISTIAAAAGAGPVERPRRKPNRAGQEPGSMRASRGR